MDKGFYFLLGRVYTEKHKRAIEDVVFNLSKKFNCKLEFDGEGDNRSGMAILNISPLEEQDPDKFPYDDNFDRGEDQYNLMDFYQYAAELLVHQLSRCLGIYTL